MAEPRKHGGSAAGQLEGPSGGAEAQELRLSSGARLLALPTAAPAPGYRGIASLQLWIRAGAAAEREHEHGLAHLFEHMVFKPFVDRAGRRVDLAEFVEARGGEVNAFTSHDETVFYATVPADEVAAVLEVLGAAVLGRSASPQLLAREREVVIEEIRQYRDDPVARSMELLLADLYGSHPYGRPVLGSEQSVRSLDIEGLRAWQARHCGGPGTVVVAVGPVDLPTLSAQVEGLFAGASAGAGAGAQALGPEPAPVVVGAARRGGPVVRVERDDLQEVYLRLGWSGGTALDDDGVALDVAAIALGQGESSRLAVGLRRRDRLVSDVHASYLAGVASGTFVVAAQAEAEHAEDASRAMLAEVEALGRTPLPPAELERARALLHSSLIYRRETVQGQAHALGYFATITSHAGTSHAGTSHAGTSHAGTSHAGTSHAGTSHAGTSQAGTGHVGAGHAGADPDGTEPFGGRTGAEAEAEYFRRLAALTPEGLRRACARHLDRGRVAMSLLVPRDRVDAEGARALREALLQACGQARDASLESSDAPSVGQPVAPVVVQPAVPAQPVAPVVATRAAPVAARPVEPRAQRDEFGTWRARLASGLRVVARPDPSLPVVGGWLVWPGGLSLERADRAGAASLIAALLTRGTGRRDGDALAREVEGLAAVLDGFCGHDGLGLQFECLSEHLPTVLARAIECASEPRFAADELDEARRVALADLEADADDPAHQAYRRMLRALYGDHPHGRDRRGTAATLAGLERRDLVDIWARDYPLGDAVLAVAGDLDLEARLAELAAGPAGRVRHSSRATAPQHIALRWPSRAQELHIHRDREQGQLLFGFPGLARGDGDIAALDLLCCILGGQTGRLFAALREREGLVYQVAANSSEHRDGGHLVVYAAASQAKLAAARAALEVELRRIAEQSVAEQELVRAKRYLIGQFESELQRRGRVASLLVFSEAYGLGASHFLRYPERIQAVSRSQLLALAQRVLDPRRRVVVTVSAGG